MSGKVVTFPYRKLRPLTAEQRAANERNRAAAAQLPVVVAERNDDHHWNDQHPDYDPDCTCGYDAIVSPDRAAAVEAAARAATKHDASTEGRRMARSERRAGKPATPGQRSFLQALITQVGRQPDNASLVQTAIAAVNAEDPLTFAAASKLIEELLLARQGQPRSNRYAQECGSCSVMVEAEAGRLENVNGAWVVYHLGECPAPVDTTDVDAADPAAAPSGLDLSALPSGRYAIPGGDTRLKVQVDNLALNQPRNPKWSGYIFVKDGAEYGGGKRYGMQRPGQRYVGDIVAALETILADPYAAAVEYGRITKRCCICNRQLENKTSVAAGIGPICARKFS